VLAGPGDALRALAALRPAVESTEVAARHRRTVCSWKRCWPWDAEKESRRPLFREKEVIQAHHDRHRPAATPSD